MATATVLVVDREETRRREVVRGLAELGFEVVAAVGAADGSRFAAGLAPDVIVVEAGVWPGDANAAGAPLRIVLESDSRTEAQEGVAVVPAGLTPAGVLDRVRTALTAREVGVTAEPGLAALAGELAAVPLLELLPRLHGARVTGRVLVDDGEIVLSGGEVASCRVGEAHGAKAFARLARWERGGFRITLGTGGGEREIHRDVLSLMALAMEDGARYDEAAARLPDLASRVRLTLGPAFSSAEFDPIQQQILRVAGESERVWDVVDRIPEPDGAVLDGLARLFETGFVALDPPDIRVRIVTDSTADLPAAIAARHEVVVVPASVAVDGAPLGDGADVTSGSFYGLVAQGGVAIEANPPTRPALLAAYRALVARSDVVSIQPSGSLSAAVGIARAAAEEGSEEFRRVRGRGVPALEVVDSALVSTPLALLVTIAARLAARRLSAHEVRARVEAMRPRVHVFFAVDRPDYFARSSSAGAVSGFLGNMLGMRPILGLRAGEIVAVERVRGEGNVSARLVELVKESVDPARRVLAGIGHAAAPQSAIRLRSLLHQELRVAELLENEIGPAVGLHVGPGCVGVAVFQPTDEEFALLRTW